MSGKRKTITMQSDVLKHTCDATRLFVESRPKRERKTYGQFFTSQRTAEFMAGMFVPDFSKPEIRILDAGAGTGILVSALVGRLRSDGYTGEISVTCYENDPKVMDILVSNLERLKSDADIRYAIRCENYILSQEFEPKGLFADEVDTYDMIIGNPPYLKISKDAPEAKAMPRVCHGAPNLYFLFFSMGIRNLADGREMVYIIPRSWTSGAYFGHFRRYLLSQCVITQMHIFGSRDKVFDGEAVLQETMIVKVRKTRERPEKVKMSCSSTSDFSDIAYYDVDYDTVVAPNGYVFLVTNEKEAEVLQRINRQTDTLATDNLPMRTGIIVDFRTREVLRDKDEEGAFPLFFSHHISGGRVSWPIGRESEYIVTDHAGYLQDNTDCLFVKRFTAKEERRRLQCGIYLKADHSQYRYISTQNKINYIRCDDPELAYGLYVLLNSTLYDIYYRILNGSTQVNSTEINNMPVPPARDIRRMGQELIGQELTEQNCNKIVDKWIR